MPKPPDTHTHTYIRNQQQDHTVDALVRLPWCICSIYVYARWCGAWRCFLTVFFYFPNMQLSSRLWTISANRLPSASGSCPPRCSQRKLMLGPNLHFQGLLKDAHVWVCLCVYVCVHMCIRIGRRMERGEDNEWLLFSDCVRFTQVYACVLMWLANMFALMHFVSKSQLLMDSSLARPAVSAAAS